MILVKVSPAKHIDCPSWAITVDDTRQSAHDQKAKSKVPLPSRRQEKTPSFCLLCAIRRQGKLQQAPAEGLTFLKDRRNRAGGHSCPRSAFWFERSSSG